MAVAIFLLIIVVGSVVFTFVSPWWFTDIASNWGNIDTTVLITFWVCGVVFVAVGLFMAYSTWKFRHREEARADYEPENSRLEWMLTIVTSIGVVLMLAPGLIVWEEYVNVPDDAQEFEVLAKQWTWAFRFPGQDGKFGTVHVRNINADNPFGMNPDDPNGADDILVNRNEVHLPLHQPFKALLRSNDVLHDFWVPEFRAKMDSVPGMITYFWFEPTRVGTYEILCAELCGRGHYTMRRRDPHRHAGGLRRVACRTAHLGADAVGRRAEVLQPGGAARARGRGCPGLLRLPLAGRQPGGRPDVARAVGQRACARGRRQRRRGRGLHRRVHPRPGGAAGRGLRAGDDPVRRGRDLGRRHGGARRVSARGNRTATARGGRRAAVTPGAVRAPTRLHYRVQD